MNWQENLIESREQIGSLLARTRRIAVLGMEKDENPDRPAYYVPKYMMAVGFEIVPVPVKYPGLEQVAGLKAYPSVSAIPGEVDLVNVFRRPADIPKHVDDILAKKPKAVWFQLGIRNDEAAEKFARAGIQVVQDRCLMVDHRMYR
jgi:predicted CoA-binding protein